MLHKELESLAAHTTLSITSIEEGRKMSGRQRRYGTYAGMPGRLLTLQRPLQVNVRHYFFLLGSKANNGTYCSPYKYPYANMIDTLLDYSM